MPIQLLCSTGTFSRFPDFTSHRAVLEYGPHLIVDGFELMFYPAWYSKLPEVLADLRSSGLPFAAVHAEKGISSPLGQADAAARAEAHRSFAANCELASALGAKLIVLHLWGLPESDANFALNLSSLSALLDIADGYGVTLAIESIPCTHFDPLHNLQIALQQDARARVALDSEFLAMHSQLETVFSTSWLWDLAAVRHVHIKDYDKQPFLPDGSRRYVQPGEGDVDFAAFFSGLKRCGFSGTISLEAPAIDGSGKVNIARLTQGLNFIRRLLA